MWKFESRDFFIPEVTCFVLSVGMLLVSYLLRNLFFCVLEHNVWRESGMACRT